MENRNFKIDCPESLINISQKIFEDLEKKKEIIFDFFGIIMEKIDLQSSYS